MARIRFQVPSDGIDLTVAVADEIIYQPVSEFNTGIRQGNASNDDRNLASFFSFEDARAGIGVNIGDVREDVDKLGDHNGAITQQFNQFIKPPARTVSIGISPSSDGTWTVKPFESDYTGTLRMIATNGLSLYNCTTVPDAGQVDSMGGLTNQIRDAAVYLSPVDGDEFILVGNEIDNAEYGINGADVLGSTVNKILQSFIEFDGKLFASGLGEMWWTIDPQDEWLELAGNWPRFMQFIGVFPFGDTYMPYALTNPYDDKFSEIVVIDVDNNTVIPLRLGIGSIDYATGIRSEIAIIAEGGREVFIYEPFRRNIRDLDWRATERNGFHASDRDALARDVLEHRRGIVVVGEIQTAEKSIQLFINSGTGWHPYGLPQSQTGANFTQSKNGSAYSTDSQEFWVQYISDVPTTQRVTSIPWFDEPYTPGTAQTITFEDLDIYGETPWFNMGFSDLPGVALALQCGGWFDTNHRVKIEYQIDFNDSSWTELGYFPGTAPANPEITNRGTPVAGTDTLVFAADGSLAGIAFKWIRFKITLTTSTDHTRSPNAFPLTLRFLKRPNLRDSVRFEVLWSETKGLNPDIDTIKDLVNQLRAVYNATTQPKITINEEVTYAMLTSYPRIPVLGSTRTPVGSDVDFEDATLIITVAELI